ncbi:MAG: c-type cytochrome [Myxococcales bacterium]|nr:c-type cytochrome [Myxococcales bacterium]
MLAAAVRILIIVIVLVALVGLVAAVWLTTRGPSAAQAARIAEVLEDTTPAGEPPAFAHCASCHLHDGSGRPDGSIPRLAGQRRAVLENKLYRLRAGTMHLPVMDPYARTLLLTEVTDIAIYLSQLPEIEVASSAASDEQRAAGAALFAQHCVACHGARGEGDDGLFASRLCGQYAGYLARRLEEAAAGTRGTADAIMQGVVDTVPTDDLGLIVAWLAAGKGCGSP